jgi:signal transduction histidine kinase
MDESLADLKSRIEELEALVSRLRHDIRSGLAPAMLAADTLANSQDAKVQRAAATVVRAIERVLEVLQATQASVPPRGDLPA